NQKLFLKNFYLKSKRSVEKPKTEGPAAYVFPSDDPRPGNQAALLRVLQGQACEIHRATAPFTVTMKKRPASRTGRGSANASPSPSPSRTPETEQRTFPAGSYLVRMDQPYSRIADALLDYQYWSPRDPQQSVYDDTGWTFGELGNVQVVRVTDVKALDAAMERINGEVRSPGGVTGTGTTFL